MKDMFHDPETKIVEQHYALVYAPRRQRGRFPENCVQVVESEAVARAGADSEKKLYAARVIGPSRSSEGLRLYYLDFWLDE